MGKENKKINAYFTEDLSTDHLSNEEKEELQKIIGELTEQAKHVVEDYVKNPSEMSGSVVVIHEKSPYLKEKN